MDDLIEECRRQELEEGAEYVSVEDQVNSAVQLLLMTLREQKRRKDKSITDLNLFFMVDNLKRFRIKGVKV
jgi:hypothetical protein